MQEVYPEFVYFDNDNDSMNFVELMNMLAFGGEPFEKFDELIKEHLKKIEIDNKVQGGIYYKFTGKKMIFLKATKSKYEIQEMTREDIYYGLETAVHTIKIIENVCKTFDNLDDYYKLIYPGKKWDRSEKLESEVKNQYRNYFGTEAYGGI